MIIINNEKFVEKLNEEYIKQQENEMNELYKRYNCRLETINSFIKKYKKTINNIKQFNQKINEEMRMNNIYTEKHKDGDYGCNKASNSDLNYSKYHYYTHTDFDRLMKENEDSKGFIVIGKYNAVMAFRNFKNIDCMQLVEENGEFKYVCNFGVIQPFIMRIIDKENISDAIEYIKTYEPYCKNYKVKKQVLVFE